MHNIYATAIAEMAKIYYLCYTQTFTKMLTHITLHKPCGRAFRLCLSILIIAISTAQQIAAQEHQIDYRAYKFYHDDIDEILTPCLDIDSSIYFSADRFTVDDHNSRYALYNSGFRARGMHSSWESYTLGGITLNSTTARILLSLGIKNNRKYGIQGSQHSGATLSTTEFLVGRERSYRSEKHMIRGELSGQNYIGGISHRKTWKIGRNNVSLKGDWEITHNIRVRTGRDLYIDGVFTNAVDCGIEASRYTRRHSLFVAATLSYNNRGLRQSSTAEAYSLLNNPRYNPSWGMQNGKMRNSRVLNATRPDILALWDYRLTATSTLHIAANIGLEWQGITSLDWFDAITPMPDNYRYMPSFCTRDEQEVEVTKAWTDNDLRYTQINWDALYHTNLLQTDGHSRYAISKRRENILNTSLAAYITSRLAVVDITAGIAIDADNSRNFKVMHDLLGGSHIIDKDYYLINDATYSNQLQNNLLHPNSRIMEGDRFGYDYRINRTATTIFGTIGWQYSAGEVDLSASMVSESTRRRGFFEKELFPDGGSLGKSAIITMCPYRIAGSWSHYILNHQIGAAAMICGSSPYAENMFLQREYNNRIINNLKLATTLSGEISYGFIINHKLTLTATLFATSILNQNDILHYYDDLAGEYVDCVVSDIDTFVGGIEAKANVIWSRYFKSSFMFSALASRYTNNANVTLYSDANNATIVSSASHIKGYNTGTPEIAAYGDVEFHVDGWSASLALHYCGLRHVTPSFVRRSDRVLNRASSDEQRLNLLDHQRLGDIVSIDFGLAKWIDFEKMSLGIQFYTRNILGTNNIVRGYEQNRIRRITIQNRTHMEAFDNRLTYGYPRTFYLGISLRI